MLVKIGLKEKLIAINELQKERKNIVYQISCINLNKFDEATRILVVKDLDNILLGGGVHFVEYPLV